MLRVFLPKGEDGRGAEGLRNGCPALLFLGLSGGQRNSRGENRRKGQGAEERLHTGFRPSSGCRFVFIRRGADTSLLLPRGGEKNA
jgi:hypothetical protein